MRAVCAPRVCAAAFAFVGEYVGPAALDAGFYLFEVLPAERREVAVHHALRVAPRYFFVWGLRRAGRRGRTCGARGRRASCGEASCSGTSERGCLRLWRRGCRRRRRGCCRSRAPRRAASRSGGIRRRISRALSIPSKVAPIVFFHFAVGLVERGEGGFADASLGGSAGRLRRVSSDISTFSPFSSRTGGNTMSGVREHRECVVRSLRHIAGAREDKLFGFGQHVRFLAQQLAQREGVFCEARRRYELFQFFFGHREYFRRDVARRGGNSTASAETRFAGPWRFESPVSSWLFYIRIDVELSQFYREAVAQFEKFQHFLRRLRENAFVGRELPAGAILYRRKISPTLRPFRKCLRASTYIRPASQNVPAETSRGPVQVLSLFISDFNMIPPIDVVHTHIFQVPHLFYTCTRRLESGKYKMNKFAAAAKTEVFS